MQIRHDTRFLLYTRFLYMCSDSKEVKCEKICEDLTTATHLQKKIAVLLWFTLRVVSGT